MILKQIVISKDNPTKLKSKEILYQCLIADKTAKINCNFYGEIGENLKPGDIVYIMGSYTSIFQGRMVLYQSAKGGVYRLRDFFFAYSNSGANMSEPEWNRETDPKT